MIIRSITENGLRLEANVPRWRRFDAKSRGTSNARNGVRSRELRRRFHLLFAVALPLFLFLGGCAKPAESENGEAGVVETFDGDGPIKVVCTTNIIKDLVRQIGGKHVTVTAIMDGPSIDPHSYTPSPKDTNLLTAADLVVYSGLHLEGQFDAALESLKHRGIPVICVTDGLKNESPSRLIQTDDGVADPHVWFDPNLWATCGEWLGSELSTFDPSHAEDYNAAAERFAVQMKDTIAEGVKLLANVPDDRRVLVTAHDAFEYFAQAFNFEVQAVQGISTESEPGVRRINQLIDLLVARKIGAVFTEQSVSEKNIQALVAGCESAGHQLTIGGKLFSDTAGPEGTPEETLAGALLHNIREIAAALETKKGQ
ncbi:Tromp-1 [Fuerstiella marisgermanici]|uniref:Tromp-1 n=1 Tax=Fuerstiella marisgermanici TaxID=1891926 RepID=A0A1P8WF65_9PLAN|nr:Tromp-1 [Fuerstiella marisgermanici]